tara:strand:+ start:69 stop:473 length:405 start_codon:yes stop_codon:yes gene_type:complete
MFRRLTSNNKPIISITNNAWTKIITIATSEKMSGFLFLAKNGGCNGFNYNLDLLSKSKLEEIIVTNKRIPPTIFEKENVKVVIDPLSEMLVLGTNIDYIFENYSEGIYENKFIFQPDKTLNSACGCGISFNPKT